MTEQVIKVLGKLDERIIKPMHSFYERTVTRLLVCVNVLGLTTHYTYTINTVFNSTHSAYFITLPVKHCFNW